MNKNHLTLDLFQCDKNLLFDKKFVRNSALQAVKLAGMKKIGEVCVKYVPEKRDDAWGRGISVAIVIAESHLSVHTLVKYNSVAIDLFSCKPFNADKIVEFFVNSFKAKKKIVHVFSRSLRLPRRRTKSFRW